MRPHLPILTLLLFLFLTHSTSSPSFRLLQQPTTPNIDNSTTNTVLSRSYIVLNLNNLSNISTHSWPRRPTSPYKGFTQIPISTALNNTETLNALLDGLNLLIIKGVSQAKIPLDTYNVTNWVAAYYQNNTNNYTIYKFAAQLISAADVTIDANVTVNYSPANDSNHFSAYYYQNNLPTKYPSPWIALNTSWVAISPLLQRGLSFGVQQILQTAIRANKIPSQSLNYNITNVTSVSDRLTKNQAFFQYVANTVNTRGVHVDVNFTVVYTYSSGVLRVNSYEYKGYNFSKKDIKPITNTTNTTVTVNNNNPSTSSNSTGSAANAPQTPTVNVTDTAIDSIIQQNNNQTVLTPPPAADSTSPTGASTDTSAPSNAGETPNPPDTTATTATTTSAADTAIGTSNGGV